MIFVFYFLAAVLVWLSFKSLTGGIAYLNFFREQLAKPLSDYAPFVTVIAPCRGFDEGLDQNLAALIEQDFREYEIVFVVDSKEDKAVPVIESIRARTPGHITAKLVVAPKADGCAQKIANLREAVLHADERSQAFVFVDSDVRPLREWLRSLVAPLADDTVGAATGYRWFISKEAGFASEMRSAWNASIASALGPNTASNFTWGGSTAIRRDVFDRIGMRDKWLGTLSDDFAVTRAMRSASLPIVFVPQALTASVENCTIGSLLEFTTRQMKITRVYMTHLWIMSFVGSALFNLVLVAAVAILVFGRGDATAKIAAGATILLVAAFSVGKAWLRLIAVRSVLTGYETELKRQFWPQITLWLFSPALFLYNSVAASLSRRMTWRGITYELKSASETVIISN